jgi:hypothetical protein
MHAHGCPQAEGVWLVRLRDNDTAKIGFSLALERVLRAKNSFLNIEWFVEENGMILGERAARFC